MPGRGSRGPLAGRSSSGRAAPDRRCPGRRRSRRGTRPGRRLRHRARHGSAGRRSRAGTSLADGSAAAGTGLAAPCPSAARLSRRPRRYSAPLMRVRPPAAPRRAAAGRRSSGGPASRPPARCAHRSPRSGRRPQRPRLALQHAGAPDDEPLAVRLDPGARPGLVGADLALELDRRPRSGRADRRSRRSGRVSVAPSSGCGRAAQRTRRASRAAPRRSRSAASSARRASSSGATSRPVERDRALGDDRSGVEALVHAHERHAGLGVAGQDGGRAPGPRRGGAAGARGGG